MHAFNTSARRLLLTLFFGSMVLLTACTSSRETAREEPREEPEERVEEPQRLPTPVIVAEPEPEPEPEPAPPPKPKKQTVQGYRIQLATATAKSDAEKVLQSANSWWRSVPRGERPDALSGELPIGILWQQPYYRVRLGNFASRRDAQRALPLFKEQFPKAFIVPDTVTIYR